MPASTSRTYVAKQDMNFQTLSEIKHFLVPLLRFCFGKIASKILHFQVFSPGKEPLVATLSKTRAFISKRNVDEQGMNIANFIEKLYFFRRTHSSDFALGNNCWKR